MVYARAKQLVGASVLSLALASATPAWAEQAGQTPAPTSTDTTEGNASPAVASTPASEQGIKDIIVTAERRETNVQSTPISITAITGDDIVRRNLSTVDSVLRDVPAVVLQGNANGAYVYIRGVGSQQDTAIGGPSVNLNFDGVYQQQTDAPFVSIYDLERVEVLRGPQGTLYGRNATAGSINIITAQPTLDGIHAKGNISFGNYKAFRAEAALNLPISDTLAVRVAGMRNYHKGYIHPSGYDDANDAGARAKLLWKPTDGVKLIAAIDYVHVGGVGNGAVDPLASHPNDAWYSTAVTGVTDLSYVRYYAQLDADLGFGTLTVLPALQRYNKYDNNILINFPTAALNSSSGRVRENQKTLEARLASNASSPFTWLLGAYYLRADGKNAVEPSRISVPGMALTFPFLAGGDTYSYAGFGQVTVPITERFRVTGGLRYTHDKKSLDRQVSATSFLKPAVSFNSTTYKAGVEFDVAPRVLAYANISTGFKAGGLDQNFTTYKPEHLRAIQGGFKSRFFDNKVQLNAEGFHYDYTNFQAQYGARCQNAAACPVVFAFANTIVNAGSATVYGGEGEAVFAPWPTGRLTSSLSYTHSNFDRLVIVPGTGNNSPAGCAATLTCTVLANQILTNQPLANAPKWTWSIGGEQDIPLANGYRITFQGDGHHYTGYWTLYRRPPQVAVESYQNPYWKWNATISLTAPEDRWSIRAFMKNIGDKAVVTSAVGPALTLAPPKTYGAQLAVQF